MADVTFVSFSSKHDVYRKTVENNVPIGNVFNYEVPYNKYIRILSNLI